MIVDCIADLHGHYPKLDGGDLLIIAGDLTAHDDPIEYIGFRDWVDEQDYKKKVIVPGNHDGEIELDWRFQSRALREIAELLVDRGIEFEGFKIYGSPWILRFKGMNPRHTAFTLASEEKLKEMFCLIPRDTDILITHAAPYGILDGFFFGDKSAENLGVPRLGSRALSDRLCELCPAEPFVHIFGHIHEGYGVCRSGPQIYVNASHVNIRHKPVNDPIRIIL